MAGRPKNASRGEKTKRELTFRTLERPHLGTITLRKVSSRQVQTAVIRGFNPCQSIRLRISVRSACERLNKTSPSLRITILIGDPDYFRICNRLLY
jgi:hypothetical protein